MIKNFSNTDSHLKIEPVRKDLAEIDFGKKYEILNDCFKIKNNVMYYYFNENTETKKFDIVELIQKLINDKTIINNVVFKHENQTKEVISYTIVNKFRFVKFLNLLDFEWGKNKMKTLRIEFDYDNLLFVNSVDYVKGASV